MGGRLVRMLLQNFVPQRKRRTLSMEQATPIVGPEHCERRRLYALLDECRASWNKGGDQALPGLHVMLRHTS